MTDGIRKSDGSNVVIGVEPVGATSFGPALSERQFLLEDPDAFRMIVGADLLSQLPTHLNKPVVDTFVGAESELAKLKKEDPERLRHIMKTLLFPTSVLVLGTGLEFMQMGGDYETIIQSVSSPSTISALVVFGLMTVCVLIPYINLVDINWRFTNGKTFKTKSSRNDLNQIVRLGRKTSQISLAQIIHENPEVGLKYFEKFLPKQIDAKQRELTERNTHLKNLLRQAFEKKPVDMQVIQSLESEIKSIELKKIKLNEERENLFFHARVIRTKIKEKINLRELREAFESAAQVVQRVNAILSVENNDEEIEMQDVADQVRLQICSQATRKAVADKIAKLGKGSSAMLLGLGLFSGSQTAQAQTRDVYLDEHPTIQTSQKSGVLGSSRIVRLHSAQLARVRAIKNRLKFA